MRIKYVGPHDSVDVGGLTFKFGVPGDVPAVLGKCLLEQADNWQSAAAKKES